MYFFYKFIDLPQRFCYNEGNAGKEAPVWPTVRSAVFWLFMKH